MKDYACQTMHVRRREKNFLGVERKKKTVKLDLHI